MPKFEWTKSEPVLTKAVNLDGLGLTPTQVTTIAVQQQSTNYKFEWHTGYHGSKTANYVYIREGTTGGTLPRLWLSGPKAGTIVDGEKLNSKVRRDVLAVAANANNLTLLLAACKNLHPTAF
jgi:hypothetical protein